MKKLLCALLSFTLLGAPAAQAIDMGDFDNIDAIMEDNALTETANRYSAVQLSLFPERATRLGFESAGNKLDRRDGERDAKALRALGIVEESLREVNRKNLSEPKKTEYDMLQGMLAQDKWELNRNRTALDPLLYSQAFASVYDLTLKKLTFQDLQDRDLAARLNALPAVAEQAEKNLTTPPSFLAQIAMEQAYYNYLAFDDVPKYLLARAQDDVSRAQTRADAREAKNEVKKMFELFKKLAQENTEQDFRLGEKDYFFVLKNRYFINEKPRAVEKYLLKNLQQAQKNLAKTLEPFAVPLQADVTLVEDINAPTEQADGEVTMSEITPEAAEQPKKKKDKKALPPPATAADFYAAARRIGAVVKEQDFPAALAKEAANLSKFFAQDATLPTSDIEYNVRPMPAYFAYMTPYLFVPPFGTQSNPTNDLFLRLPAGNETAKQQMLNKEFNVPTLKLLMASQLVPGLYYRSAYNRDALSSFRKMYSVPTLRNGWTVYAQHLASRRGYIITDEELLHLAWADYVRAAAAYADYMLHTKQYTYTDALDFLTAENGFEKAQAQELLKRSAVQPAEALSYLYGYDALNALHAKYQKKQGKKFSLADFHAKLMNIGDVPPARLEAEMENAYRVEKSHLTQALSTPFYLD